MRFPVSLFHICCVLIIAAQQPLAAAAQPAAAAELTAVGDGAPAAPGLSADQRDEIPPADAFLAVRGHLGEEHGSKSTAGAPRTGAPHVGPQATRRCVWLCAAILTDCV